MANNHFRIIGLSLVVGCSYAEASGFFLPEATYANLGTGGAGDGVYTGSAAAIWANPAVMPHMNDDLTTLTGSVLNLDIQYKGLGEDGSSNSTLPIAGFFHTQQINEDLYLGLALGSLGGATIDYGTDWQGAAQVSDVALLTYQINPSISYKVNPKVSVAAGLQFNYAFLQANTRGVELDSASDWAFGYNLGLVYEASESTRLGLSYRSKLEHHFESDTTVSDQYQGKYSTGLIMPNTIDASISFKGSDKLTLMGTIQWHQWSSMENTIIPMEFQRVDPIYVIDRQWDDVWHLGLGGEYDVGNKWALKLGYSYETSPLDNPALQTPELPVGEQHRYSIGVSRTWDDQSFDIYYQYTDLGDIDIDQSKYIAPLSGKFTGSVHFIGMGYTF